jgi:quercetin dioxygenase-like cupin family protein
MGSVRVVRGATLPSGTTSGSVSRRSARVDEHTSLATVWNEPGATTGWHHHGQHTAYLFVLRGPVLVEWGPGGRESAELHSGDFCVLAPNTVHRETNPGSEQDCWVGFLSGTGPEVVNVSGPEPG